MPGEPVSLWIATTPETSFPRMAGDISVDVAVLGGGHRRNSDGVSVEAEWDDSSGH